MLMAMLFTVPLAGMSGDYFTRKKMLIVTAIITILLVVPCFYLLQFHSVLLALISLGTATVLSSFDQGNTLAVVVENCPENVRYRVFL